MNSQSFDYRSPQTKPVHHGRPWWVTVIELVVLAVIIFYTALILLLKCINMPVPS
jgi:hypothetical protein